MPETFEPAAIDLEFSDTVQALVARCPHAECIKFLNDEYLISKGDSSQEVYVLLRGSCVVEAYPPEDKESRGGELALLEGNTERPVFLGEMAYLGEGVRTASVRSVMSTWAIRLRPEDLDTIIAEIPDLTRILCGQFTKRLREANRQITHLQEQRQMQFQEVFLSAGEVLFEAGAPADDLYQLLSGTMVLTRGGASEECVSGDDVFLEAGAYFRDQNHEATASAKGGAMLIRVSRESKAAAIRNFPQLALKLMG